MFGIDGKQFPARFRGGGHDEFTGGDENFFVGERDGAAEFNGFVGGLEANDADRGGKDDFGGGVGGYGEHAVGAVMNVWEWGHISFAEARG